MIDFREGWAGGRGWCLASNGLMASSHAAPRANHGAKDPLFRGWSAAVAEDANKAS